MYLSLDLASKQSGWAVFNDDGLMNVGIITPRPLTLKADERLPIIKCEVDLLIRTYAPIHHAILETPVGGDGPTNNWLTMSVLFMVHGAIRCLFQEHKIDYSIVSPSTWQNRVRIHKARRQERKDAAREYASKKYNLPDNLEQDIYDALCLYDAWVDDREFNKNKTEQKGEWESAF